MAFVSLAEPVDVPVPDELERPVIAARLPSAVVPIVDNDEALVDLGGIPSVATYHDAGLPGATETPRLRAGVVDRLQLARRSLPPGFDLVVLDAWRSPTLQRALYDEHYNDASTLRAGYVSDPDSATIVPPHTTGGAVDLTLSWQRRPLALGTQFDSFEPTAWTDAFEPAGPEPVRSLRRLLTQALTAQGFCGYPWEWSHFSYGDQVWAYNNGGPAVYDATS